MKVVILCGGIGSRMKDYSLPKPLNMIYGKPAIYYVLQNIPDEVTELYFIYGSHLKKYNFEEIIVNLFKKKKCIFTCIDYFTRGPVETAYVGTMNMVSTITESIVFLDNDNIYTFPEEFFKDKPYNFLGTSIDTTGYTQYSFVQQKENSVFNIVEKERISNIFCCGVYGFQNLDKFRSYAREVLMDFPKKTVKKEVYMSDVFRHILGKNEYIQSIPFTNQGNHIGSLKELEKSLYTIKKPKMRICFDLDNTLVTYPTKAGDYSTVKPIQGTIELAKNLHKEGNTIIIHTARRMETHKHNMGAVIKDIGKVTFETLEKFGIPYDELIFGKPLADIYIDDRSINPYKTDFSFMGLFNVNSEETIINKLPNNKYNELVIYNENLVKKGPSAIMRGEYYVYSQLYQFSTLKQYFPELYSYYERDTICNLEIEYIKGIPLYYLFKNNLFTKDLVIEILNILEQMHNCVGPLNITQANIKNNYVAKLKARYIVEEDYPFEDAIVIQEKILKDLEVYVESDRMKLVPFIHGDLWFSNMLYTYDNKIKCIDMKGIVDKILTTNGDPLYDYAKLYQSFLGFDLVMWDSISNYNETMKEMKEFFEVEVEKRGICLTDLKVVTISLISGTLHAVSSEKKSSIWNFIKRLIDEYL